MIIWIDADACPKVIKEIVFRAAQRCNIPVCLVANRDIYTPRSPLITKVIVSLGEDVADNHIVQSMKPEDIAITADVPLAALIVAKGALALNPRGQVYTEENVREYLSMRNFSQDLRDYGIDSGGQTQFSTRDKHLFASALDRLLANRHNKL